MDERIEVIVKYNGDIMKLEQELGIEVEVLDENYAILTLEPSVLDILPGFREVEAIERPKNLFLNITQPMQDSCVFVNQNNESKYTGKGTIVAVLDSGIDLTHPDFIDDNGNSRILALWDQTKTGTPPAGFKAGSEYSNSQINELLASRTIPENELPGADLMGHGTSVAGIAAGNGNASIGENRGMAPNASLIIVKLGERGFQSFARTTEMMRAIKYTIDKAISFGLPAAINISYGTNESSHDGKSLFEQYIDDMSEKWKCVIAVASGNEGIAGHHFSGTIKNLQEMNIPFVVSGGFSSFYLTLWKNFSDLFSIELLLPNNLSTGILEPFDRVRTLNYNNMEITIINNQPTHYNEDQEIYVQVNTSKPSVDVGIGTIRIRAVSIVDGHFNIWLPVTEEVGTGTAFSAPDRDITITSPATASKVISVGGYNPVLDTIAPFSGRGYTRNIIRIKPDLAAPAVNILASRSGGGYDLYTGTSFAAPFVSGAAAVMMEWGITDGNDPFLFGQRIKAFLKLGSNRKQGVVYPNKEWGYGSLCLQNTIDYLNRL